MSSEVDLSCLNEAERIEIEQCKLIIQFAKDVNTGVHPRVTKLPYLRKLFGDANGNEQLLNPNFIKYSKTLSKIDYECNYYEILGLEPTSTKNEIHERYEVYATVYHPEDSAVGRSRWEGKSDKYRQMAFRCWKFIKKAHHILSNDDLRALYDQKRSMTQPVAVMQPHSSNKSDSENQTRIRLRPGKDLRDLSTGASAL